MRPLSLILRGRLKSLLQVGRIIPNPPGLGERRLLQRRVRDNAPYLFRRPLRAVPTGARPPWIFLAVTAVALVIQLNPAWRSALLYDRTALDRGELWRAWTGHLVHFGWPHFIADGGLLFLLGWLMETRYPRFSRLAFALMPPFISAAVYWFDPTMQCYGGLSALNLGLLLYLAAQGWRRDLTDWFWPAVLAIYVGEVVFEAIQGGRGGGMIAFDDSTISVATSAHLAGAAYVVLALLLSKYVRPARQPKGNPVSHSERPWSHLNRR